LAPDVPDIGEDLLLGRTLLEQGHLSTAQRVLVKLCQQHPNNSEAFRGLGDVLHRKGDETRARIIAEYAADLGVHDAKTPRPTPLPETRPTQAGARQGPTGQAAARNPPASRSEFVTPLVDPFTPPVDSVTPRPTPPTPSVGSVTPRPNLVTPPVVVSTALTMPSSSHPVTLPSGLAAAAPASARPGAKLGKYLAVAAVLLAGLGILGYRFYKPGQRRGPSPREELDSALASGSLDRLMRVRDRVRSALGGAEPDADALVRLALVEAFLTLDYGVAGAKNAEEDLRRLRPGDRPDPQRLALVEAVRALLALAAGDREMAREHVDVGLAWAAKRPPAALLLASSRVRVLAGDAAGAGRDLDSALRAAPDFAAVVADWSAQRLDTGDASAARRVAREFLAKNKTAWRVQLVVAEAERTLGERGWIKHVESACRGDNRGSRAMRAACSLAAAQEARMDGERLTATRKARTAGQSSDDPRVLADSALVLASLGEIDAADEVLARVRKLADGKAVPLAWADLAVRLGRGQTDGAAVPAERPAQPERQLVALRAAYLKGGGAALAAAIKSLPAGASEIDPDLRTFVELGREGSGSPSDRATLERRAEHGSPVASFVLGILAAREGDHKQAAKWLEKALAGHGDACRAALLYLSALQALDRPTAPNRPSLRALRARNAQCPIPEM
jgi:tetratricopeptide (TPR) repeat protein